ncbi:MAG: BMP family ABC transporter substrate-binding protein [Oscillospiraceae bacterium]|nr:BMP family ABC transporter substrate-binding protein [Oscillospiraceae bacterium]
MKRTIALLLALVMVFALCACSKKTEPTPTDNATESDYRVAMITDYGDITDQSFNQTTYEACKAFCEENSIDFTYYKPAGDNTPDRIAMVEKAVDEGYNVIVMPGFAFAGTISGTQDQYPDVKFIALDVSEYDITSSFYKTDADGNVTEELLDPENEPHIAKNVYSAVYQEELCGYMAGYAAVKLGYTKLGFLGGMAVPAVQRYGYGFVQGCDAAAAEMNIKVDVKYAYGNQFFGDADITAAMDTWYAAGTEVVFACGGGIYTSAVDAAKKVEGAKVMGVDVDQAGVIASYANPEDATEFADLTVTSAMKGLAATVKTMLTETILNNNWDKFAGKVETLGLVSGDDPEANYVQIPMESTQWVDGKFTQDDYKALVKAMFDGTVKVSSDITAMPTTTAANVEDLGNIK